MKPRNLITFVFTIFTVTAGIQMWFTGRTVAAEISLPTFEVDKTWPKVPAKWKLGDASSFAIDAKDNVWLLHRPRTLKADQAAMAAPPVMVFDTAGNFVKAWGGRPVVMNGRSASTVSISIPRDSCGSAETTARRMACQDSNRLRTIKSCSLPRTESWSCQSEK